MQKSNALNLPDVISGHDTPTTNNITLTNLANLLTPEPPDPTDIPIILHPLPQNPADHDLYPHLPGNML